MYIRARVKIVGGGGVCKIFDARLSWMHETKRLKVFKFFDIRFLYTQYAHSKPSPFNTDPHTSI